MRAFETARFTRGADDRIAETACTHWTYESPTQNGTTCFTGDGVMLRLQNETPGQPGVLEAIRVDYAAQDPARYQRPLGYRTAPAPDELPRR